MCLTEMCGAKIPIPMEECPAKLLCTNGEKFTVTTKKRRDSSDCLVLYFINFFFCVLFILQR